MREVAQDARAVARDLGSFAADEARRAAGAAARDLAQRVEAAPEAVRERAAAAVERAARQVAEVAPRAAQGLRRAAGTVEAASARAPAPAPAPAPRAPAPAPAPAPAAEPGTRRQRKPRKSIAQELREHTPKPATKGQGKKAGQAKSLHAAHGLTRVVDGAAAYMTDDDRRTIEEHDDHWMAQPELEVMALDNYKPKSLLLGGDWQVAGQPRWARRWLSVVYLWVEDKGWIVMGQTALAVTVADSIANSADMVNEYRKNWRIKEQLHATIYVPVRPV